MPDANIFGTVLVNRKTNARPKDWELQLRPICRKIRVVENLLGGAHLMVTGSPSIAVRIYNAEDASRFEDTTTTKANTDYPDMEIKSLPLFRDTYEHSIVIFVLPTGQLQCDQLGRRESFVNVAQKALLSNRVEDGNDQGRKHTSRTAIVSDISQVLRIIESVVQSLLPEKREKRRSYFAQVANQRFIPGEGTQQLQEVIANHATKAFVAWADRFAMPEGDASVALSVLGSLANVTTADKAILNDVPIRNASKEMMTRFFGAEKADTPSQNDNFHDDIDDSEYLKCPDLSTHNATYPLPHSYHATTNPMAAQYFQPHHPYRTYGDGNPVSGVMHRDHFFNSSGSNSSNIQSFHNDSDRMHMNQYTHQGYGDYSYPAQSVMHRTNQFM